jgi:hypothetical protein
VNLGSKLRILARGLQSSSQRQIGSVRDQILMANVLIMHLNVAQEITALSVEELGLKHGLKPRVLGLTSLERTIPRQRARVAGLSTGDANAQYFQILASKRRR